MSSFSTLSVLVVENHMAMRRLLYEMLRGFGVRNIEEARNAAEAREHVFSQPFDLIILDFFLGDGLDGGDFASLLRRSKTCANRRTPILLVTSAPDHHKVTKARDCGINEVLAKPIAPKDLFRRMHAMIAYPRPFVISKGYVGPSRRRRKATPRPDWAERRRTGASGSAEIRIDNSA